jgi:arylsulfatase A-like enzyme
MFTGRFPHELSTGFLEPLDDTYPTLAEILSAQGYLTAGFVANLAYCSYEFGLQRGFTHYEDYVVSPGEFLKSSSLIRSLDANLALRDLINWHEYLDRKNAAQINDSFLRWLSDRDKQRPFFAFLNYYDAHDPYLPPLEFALKFAPERPRGNIAITEVDSLSPEDIRQLNDAYDGTIAYLDHQIGLLFDELERRGELDNTLVIITSDHGEQFGEHNLMMHINSLYMPLVHVPLLISFPGRVPAGVSVKEAVSLRDLPTTILDLARLNSIDIPGKSLAGYWNTAPGTARPEAEPLLAEVKRGWGFPDWYPGMKGPLKSILLEDYYYIKNYGDGSEELYDLSNDPLEENNLADSQSGRREIPEFRMCLETMLQQS